MCCGVSAGGWAASVCGLLINAAYVISISGYFNLLCKVKPSNPLLYNAYIDGDLIYTNVNSMYKQNGSLTKIYYFYSAFCDEDVKQMKQIDSLKIQSLAFNSNRHGQPMTKRTIIHLLKMRENEIRCLSEKNTGRIIERDMF